MSKPAKPKVQPAGTFVVSAAPHILPDVSTRRLMLSVLIALTPTLIAATFIFGLQVLLLTGVTMAACAAFEALWCFVLKKPQTVNDLSALVTGMILAFNLPSTFPPGLAIIGSFIAIIIVKMLFGGIGCNIANPALVARIVLQTSFTAEMLQLRAPASMASGMPVSSATPLASSFGPAPQMIDLILGTHAGMLGETCALLLVLGGIFLIVTKVVSPVAPLCYVGGVFVLKLLLTTGRSVVANGFGAGMAQIGAHASGAFSYLLMGGLLLAAFFMATDYTTSPYTRKGKMIYGFGLAGLTVLIREWGSMPEGVSYALLLMNLLVPFINARCHQRPLGAPHLGRRSRRRAEPKGGVV